MLAAGAFPPPARAGVVVLDNHTTAKVSFIVTQPDGGQVRRALDRGEVVPVPVEEPG